jgi:hypothetical protein
MFSRASGMLFNSISMAFSFYVCLKIKNKNVFMQFHYVNLTSHLYIVSLDLVLRKLSIQISKCEKILIFY